MKSWMRLEKHVSITELLFPKRYPLQLSRAEQNSNARKDVFITAQGAFIVCSLLIAYALPF